jgi:hypothetical protein
MSATGLGYSTRRLTCVLAIELEQYCVSVHCGEVDDSAPSLPQPLSRRYVWIGQSERTQPQRQSRAKSGARAVHTSNPLLLTMRMTSEMARDGR